MSLEKITQITGRAVHVPGDDIDTDRVIPARFMKCVTFDGLGDYLFFDVRHDADGNAREHPLNDPRFAGASVLFTGNNFGCGSSREHAPQSLKRAGFNAVVAEGFAEIFFGNSTNLGIPCVTASRDDIRKLAAAVEAKPSTAVTIDLEALVVRAGEVEVPCNLRPGARDALLNGRWDPIAELLEGSAATEGVAARLPYMAAGPAG